MEEKKISTKKLKTFSLFKLKAFVVGICVVLCSGHHDDLKMHAPGGNFKTFFAIFRHFQR